MGLRSYWKESAEKGVHGWEVTGMRALNRKEVREVTGRRALKRKKVHGLQELREERWEEKEVHGWDVTGMRALGRKGTAWI